MAFDDDPRSTPASVRAELVAALEGSQPGGADRGRSVKAGVFLTRVVGRLRRPDAPMGPAAVKAAKHTRRVTARFGFDDDVADVFVALAAAIADEASDLWDDELADMAARPDRGGRAARLVSVADQARARARLGSSFVDEIVPAVATGLAGFVPGLALRRPLAHPSVAVGAAVAGGLASTAMVGTSAVPVALALSVVTEAAETYAQGSVLAAKFRAEGREPTVTELLDEMAALTGDGIFGRSRPEAAAMLRTTALPRLADTLERRVGVRVASLATVVGPAVVEGGLVTWGLVKASRHRLGTRGDALPPTEPSSEPPPT